jgi:hypothetical protein
MNMEIRLWHRIPFVNKKYLGSDATGVPLRPTIGYALKRDLPIERVGYGGSGRCRDESERGREVGLSRYTSSDVMMEDSSLASLVRMPV